MMHTDYMWFMNTGKIVCKVEESKNAIFGMIIAASIFYYDVITLFHIFYLSELCGPFLNPAELKNIVSFLKMFINCKSEIEQEVLALCPGKPVVQKRSSKVQPLIQPEGNALTRFNDVIFGGG